MLLTAWIGALLIVRLSIPFTPIRAALLVVVVGGTVLGTRCCTACSASSRSPSA
ncbi:MAG: hypothetical protein ACLSVD_07845 [Eggerthellaceae bacterium]